jgi:hypothetical protein
MREDDFEADRDEAKFRKPPTTPASDTTHECDSGDFDRTICACGVMHSYCATCGGRQDKCSAADTPMTASDTDRLTEALPVIVKVLTDEGGAPGNSLHSWRCEYPDRYGECDCLTQTAESILAALDEIQAMDMDQPRRAVRLHRECRKQDCPCPNHAREEVGDD